MKKLMIALAALTIGFTTLSVKADDDGKWESSPVAIGLFAPIQIPPTSADVYGLRLGGLFGWNQTVDGLEVSVCNLDGLDSAGLQIGIANIDRRDYQGVSIGFGNYADSVEGIQFGLLNLANKSAGIQFGLVNACDEMQGVQIGLLNMITTSPLPVMVLLNAQF